MPRRPIQRVAALTFSLAVAFGSIAAMPRAVEAGHTIAGGDCWQVGTPFWCRTVWSSSNRLIDLKLYNQFSNRDPPGSTRLRLPATPGTTTPSTDLMTCDAIGQVRVAVIPTST